MQLLYNANIYTFDRHAPRASALLIDGEKILAVGEGEMLRQSFQHPIESLDLEGQVLIPGLIDAHIHLEQYALLLQKIDCETESKAECLNRIAERVQQTPPGAWIQGHGWNQNRWKEGYGSAEELDRIAPKNPVFLTAKSLHAAWVNSEAMRMSGIRNDSPDPPNGALGRDADGRLNGLLFEYAITLVQEKVPEPNLDEVVEALRSAQIDLWRKGLTGLHDFDRSRCFSALQIMRNRQELHLRVLKSIPLEDLKSAVEIGLRSGFGDDFLRLGGVKIFADGALGPRTAAMLQPYENEPGNLGMAFIDGEELYEIGRTAVDGGLSLAVHAIGDRANHEVLNGFERLREYERKNLSLAYPLHHRIEHVQLIHPDDAPRLAQLDIAASMQPIHATSDMEMADRYWGERSAWAYGLKTQLNHRALLVFGSDAPVEKPDPFGGVHAAVTRRRSTGEPGTQGWYPEQRLGVQQALEAYILGPSILSGTADYIGKITPGYLADLILLDRDPFSCPSDELYRIKPTKTMVGGEWVFES